MRLFLTIICLLLTTAAFSQASDFVVVKKKNNRTLQSYFPGTPIACQTVYGNNVNGIIQSIRNDSLFIKQYDVRTFLTQWGVTTVDTVGSYLIGMHYKDIEKVVFKRRESFGYIKNGTMFMIGGLGYGLLNVINGKYLKEPITSADNLKRLGIAMGVAGGGYLMGRIRKHNNRNGKRYRVEYIHMNKKGF